MESNQMYKDYLSTLNERTEFENKLNNFIDKWQSGELILSEEQIELTIKKGKEKIEELRKKEQDVHNKYIANEIKEKEKLNAAISVQHNLNVRPSDINITGGILSSKASESHLTAELKSPEKKEEEKLKLLAILKSKVKNGEISLQKASKLVNYINVSYDSEEKNNNIKK